MVDVAGRRADGGLKTELSLRKRKIYPAHGKM